MEELEKELENLNTQLQKLWEPQQPILRKIQEYKNLLKIEKAKLEQEETKVEENEQNLNNQLIPLTWVNNLLKNDKEDMILLNDRCLGEKRKFFEALRQLKISEYNSDKIPTETGIGKYLNLIREKYIIDTCILKLFYKTKYFSIAEEDDEHEFNPEPDITIMKKDKDINGNYDDINFDEILEFYTEQDRKFISSDGDSDGIWNELNLKLRCWHFILKK